MKNEYQVIVNQDSEAVFLIGPEKPQPPGNLHSYFVNQAVFERVQGFVDLFKPGLDSLIQKSDSPCTNHYWEKNYHDRIADLLLDLMPGTKRVDISNSLSALGF
jgi:hypothetical protein